MLRNVASGAETLLVECISGAPGEACVNGPETKSDVSEPSLSHNGAVVAFKTERSLDPNDRDLEGGNRSRVTDPRDIYVRT